MDFLVPPLLTPTSPFVRSLDLWPCEQCALLAFADPSRLDLEPRNLLRLWDEAAVRVSSFSCACFSSYLFSCGRYRHCELAHSAWLSRFCS